MNAYFSIYTERLSKYAFMFAAAFIITYLLTPLIRRLALAAGMVDTPGGRKIHERPTPRAGGVAIFLAFHATYLAGTACGWIDANSALNFGWWRGFLVASAAILLIGLTDDWRSLPPLLKLAGQVAAALFIFLNGSRIESIHGVTLPVWLDLPLTVFWIIVITNAFNLIDGIDGLASGLAIIAAAGLGVSFVIRRNPPDTLAMLALAGACLAFLRYNFYPAKVFLGDSGSMFIGFTLACVPLVTGGKSTFVATVAMPLLAFGIPLFDTILAIWRRSLRRFFPHILPEGNGSTIVSADREHLHHRILGLGLDQRKVAGLLYGLSAALVVVGLLALLFHTRALGIFLIAFLVGAYIIARHLARVELWDTGRVILAGLNRPSRVVVIFLLYPVWDLCCLAISLLLATWLFRPVVVPDLAWNAWLTSLPLWISPVFLVLCAARTYNRVWSLARFSDYLVIGAALVFGMVLTLGIALVTSPEPRGIIAGRALIFGSFSILLIVGGRIAVRGTREFIAFALARYGQHNAAVPRVLVYGAAAGWLGVLNEEPWPDGPRHSRQVVVGLLDDDRNLRFRSVGGYPVLGNLNDLPKILERHRVDKLILAAPLAAEQLKIVRTLAAERNIEVVKAVLREEPAAG